MQSHDQTTRGTYNRLVLSTERSHSLKSQTRPVSMVHQKPYWAKDLPEVPKKEVLPEGRAPGFAINASSCLSLLSLSVYGPLNYGFVAPPVLP